MIFQSTQLPTKLLKTTIFCTLVLLLLVGCSTSGLKEALTPAFEQVETGMSYDEVVAIAEENELDVFEYPSDESGILDEEALVKVAESGNQSNIDVQVLQLTKASDDGICFFKASMVDDGEGDLHVISVDDIFCSD